MRHAMIAMLLCACAHFTSARHPTVAEAEANYQEFYKEFTAGHHNEAKAIADQKKVDRRRVVQVVTTAMWQAVTLAGEMGIRWAKETSRKFQLDRETETAFAQKAFAYLVLYNSCDIAANLAFYFKLGPTYADKAIKCAQSSPNFSLVAAARLACGRPGTKDLQIKLIAGWVENFKQSRPDQREHYSMAEIAVMCPLTADQYSDLFAIGIKDKKPAFAKLMLEKGDFNKTPADYDDFIAMSVGQYECGLAAAVAIKQNLPDNTVEALFLNPKCFGGTLSEVDPALIPSKRADWFFELGLQAHEYLFVYNLVAKLKLVDSYFSRIVDEAIATKDFDQIIDFDPPMGWDKRLYQYDTLDKIMDLNEEWFVVRYAILRNNSYSPEGDENWYGWIERAYLHALRRGAFTLAADIAHKHDDIPEFSEWGINLAFESACKSNLDEAGEIARRWLGRQAWHRVVLLVYQKKREEESIQYQKKQEEARKRKKRACQKGGDWCVTQ